MYFCVLTHWKLKLRIINKNGTCIIVTLTIIEMCLTSYQYTGRKNVTTSGRSCIAWSSFSPPMVGTSNPEFPDGSVTAAANYCRDPRNSGTLWCYTKDDEMNVIAENCTVDLCSKTFLLYSCITNSLFKYFSKNLKFIT